MTDIYEFTANTLQGSPVSFESFRGKVVLIVNTASKCGFTPQFAGLEELWRAYGDKGLVVIGFAAGDIPQLPANQILLRNRRALDEPGHRCRPRHATAHEQHNRNQSNSHTSTNPSNQISSYY